MTSLTCILLVLLIHFATTKQDLLNPVTSSSDSPICTSINGQLACASDTPSRNSPMKASSDFSICNLINGQPACASDIPDRMVSLNKHPRPAVCPVVLCAWECRKDPSCLEFNIHYSNWTCDLYYNPPTRYQLSADCTHFQVCTLSKYRSILI